MGKRSSGAFTKMLRQQQMLEAQDAQQRTAEIADQQSKAAELSLPTEQLQEAVPQAMPIDTDQLDPRFEGYQGPRPENLQRADLTFETDISPTQETLDEVQRQQIPKLGELGVAPTTAGMLSPEERGAALVEQLEDERVVRPGAFNEATATEFGRFVDDQLIKDYSEGDSKSEDDGRLLLSNALEAGAKSFQVSAGNMNLFGQEIDLNTTPKFEDSITDPHGFLRRYAGEFSYTIKGEDKLNMLEEPANPNSEIRPEMGRAAILATILEVGNRLNDQALETDKEQNQRRFDGALDRINIGKAIGQRIERLLYPTNTDNPADVFTGETSQFGYNYRLTPEEQSVLGQGVIQGFAHSPAFDWLIPYTIKDENNKQKATFRTTREGEIKLNQIRRAARLALGFKDHDRPVSLVQTSQGRLRGEGAYTQKEITAAVKKNQLSVSAIKAIEALGSVAHTTSPHKVLLARGMFNRAATDPSSVFAKFSKQNQAYIDKKYGEILRNYEAQARIDSTFTPESTGYQSFEEASMAEAIRITEEHMRIRNQTVEDAIARMGNSFYYGYTAINNSERLMITQTELNYQADKVARFVVDGAVPARFKKGSNNNTEQGFFKILARSLVEGADKMSPERQLIEFEARKDEFIKYGNQVLNYTLQNEGRLGTAKENNLADLPPLKFSADLEQFLSDAGKDEFYFVLDALHELARYNQAADGQTFQTRVKAEIDGNSNGATIQAMQMGVENILKKGGVLYQDVEAIQEDIRDDVFDYLITEEQLVKEPEIGSVLEVIKATPGKVKELMKSPIMTSIYGKEPAFHRDTAKKFYDDNSEMFADVFLDPEEAKNRELIIDKLQERLNYALTNGLGGALEHAVMAKRIGRIFNIANEIAEIEGANGFKVQAGGFEYVDASKVKIPLAEGAQQTTIKDGIEVEGRKVMDITTKRREASALAEAGRKKVGAAKYNNPDMGSKLRNQLAVNATQNIDATIAQNTVARVIPNQPGALVMQVYDAFMGDANSFGELIEVSNQEFYEVNKNYNMLERERDALRNLKDTVKAEVARRKSSGEKFDIGTEGEFKGLGNFIARAVGAGSIIMRDMPEGKARYKALTDSKSRESGRGIANFARVNGWKPTSSEVLIEPEKYQQMFNAILSMLNVEQDLDKMIRETNQRRSEILNEIKKSAIRQYS